MYKKLAVLSTTIMLGLGNAIAIPTVKADTISIQKEMSNANSSVTQAQQGLSSMTAQVNRVNQAIQENNSKIQDVQSKIAETNTEVNQLKDQIKVVNDRIEKRNNILKDRAKALQETGGDVSYLDVLLGATSFQDFVDRIGSVATLVQADNDLLQQFAADKQAVTEKQTAVQTKLANLTAMKTDLDGMQQQLAEQKAQNDQMQAQLEQQAKDGNSKLADLMAQDRQFASTAIATGVSEIQKGASASAGSNFSVPALSVAAQGSGSIDTVIRAGYKYIGNSVYVFGGGRTAYDVAHGYFDCSGFVHWAFAQAGINVGTTTDSLLGDGSRVSPSSMRPGDLVFFNTYKTNGHVGIYIGGGKFIGSQSSTGVAVASLSNPYWSQAFSGVVVRVIN